MKRFILLFMFIPVIANAVTHNIEIEDEIKAKQEKILKKIDYLENQATFSLTGRGFIWFENLQGEGNALDYKKSIREHINNMQIDFNLLKRIFPTLTIFAGLRFYNDFSGFYGLGDSFEARELYVESIMWGFLKIRVGDFLQKLTPLTFYAPVPGWGLKKGIFDIFEEKKTYDKFLINNCLPLQGIQMDAKFKTDIYFDSLHFYGSIARLDKTIYNRFVSSVKIDLTKNESLTLTGTIVNYYDIKETESEITEIPPISDTVFSVLYDLEPLLLLNNYNTKKDLPGIKLSGEIAQSVFITNLKTSSETIQDYGMNLSIAGWIYKNRLKLTYIDIGNEFYSPAAQSSVYNISTLSSDYTLSYLNEQELNYHFADREYNNQIKFYRNWYNPVNFTFPMNEATPNRKGIRIEYLTRMLEIFELKLSYGNYKEIRAMRTKYKRDFKNYTISLLLDFGSYKNNLPEVFLKLQSEKINRKDDERTISIDESENLKNLIYIVEGNFKITKRWSLLTGFSSWEQKGTKWNDFANLINPLSEDIVSIYKKSSFKQYYITGGLKYNINLNSFILVYYKYITHCDKTKENNNYEIHFINLYTSLLF